MRSLSRVIKADQYPPIVSSYVLPKRDLPPASPKPKPKPAEKKAADVPGNSPPKAPEAENKRAAAGKPERDWKAGAEQEARQIEKAARTRAGQVVEDAFAKAKKIVDAAQQYRSREEEKARKTIADETASEKKRGYSEGYALGTEQGKKDGTSAGYRDGYSEGGKKAEADNGKNLQELGSMIKAVEKAKTKILHDFESDLQDLATAMAKAILKKDLEIDDQAMRSIILSAMQEYRNQEWIRIYVSDKTANILLKADHSIVDALKDISENVKVVVSPDLNDGGCILETPDQVIDAGVDSQLQKIKSAIGSAMNDRPQ